MHLRLLSLALLLTLPFVAHAEQRVSVLWLIDFTTPNGPPIRTRPTPAYMQTLAACGYQPNFRVQVNYLPLSALRCNGVLNFSNSQAIKKRVEARIDQAIARGHKALAGRPLVQLRASLKAIDFAISPFGVFFSDQDGPGDARRIALNVEQVKLVILNKMYWVQIADKPDTDAILAHEAFGAMGLGDTDYGLSNTLILYAKTDYKPGDGEATSDPAPRPMAGNQGGGSVVGRGGDQNQQIFKASLLAATEKPIQLDGVSQNLIPTKQELIRTINATVISTAKPEFFKTQRIFCQDPEGKDMKTDIYCGTFILKGNNNAPFLLITRQWAEFPESDRWKLLLKIYQQIVTALVREKMH